MIRLRRCLRRLALVPAVIFAGTPALAELPSSPQSVWITLGTNAGPRPNARRSQPANLLRVGGQLILVDCGDGASVQMARAGFQITALRTVVLSHLHFDHSAGLFALIAERYQLVSPGVLTIYGPPGTRATVDGLVMAMAPSPAAGARASISAAQTVKVVEIGDGTTLRIGNVALTAAANTHYIATPEGPGFVSLSYRFDLPDRSIVYTGDTGPSASVDRLAQGVDLLISEIIDPQAVIAASRSERADLPEAVWAQIAQHLEKEHLVPAQVGLLAARAHVKSLVLTHEGIDVDATAEARAAIARYYRGRVTFARDLDKF